MMLLPRFSLKQLLAVMAASSLFFLVAAFAVRGEPWAISFTIAILSVVAILLVHAGFFFAAWVFGAVVELFQKRNPPGPQPEPFPTPRQAT